LMAARGAYDPEAQRKILHIYTEANTDDPQLAEELVPLEEKPISEATQLATLAMGTLMAGLPVVQRRGLSVVDYAGTLLESGAQVIAQIEGLIQVPNSTQIRMMKVAGLTNVLEHAGQMLQMIAGDPTAKDAAKALNEQLMDLGGRLEGLAQQLDKEIQESDPQAADGEMMKAQAKLQALLIEANMRAQIKEHDAQQKRDHKDSSWSAEERRRDATTTSELERKRLLTIADARSQLARTQIEIASTDLKTAAEIKRGNAKES
jgi:hypothetical protein